MTADDNSWFDQASEQLRINEEADAILEASGLPTERDRIENLVAFEVIVHPEHWCPACGSELPTFATDGCEECRGVM